MLTLAREVCRSIDAALAREWLVTNGIGGYASSTICGCNTRRYHGLLVSALKPPVGRTVTLAKIDEQIDYDDQSYYLGTNEYGDGTIHPSGLVHLQRFDLEGSIPTFSYSAGPVTLEKRVWMEHGRNTTYVEYRLLSESTSVIQLTLTPLAAFRDYHSQQHGAVDWNFKVTEESGAVEIVAYDGAAALRLVAAPSARFSHTGVWYWNFLHRIERERGLDDREDLYAPGLFRASINPGESLVVVATTEDRSSVEMDSASAYRRERAREGDLLTRARVRYDDDFGAQLVLAADQFIVRRSTPREGDRCRTVVAGYHWFSDWGRDTMIALPGLAIATGRAAEAGELLRCFASFVDRGMIPNRFPDAGELPEYNTVDATLWYFQALDQYLRASGDEALLVELLPMLEQIVDWHRKGTRYSIGVDSSDGLLHAGEPGVQVTWMDAKVGEWVVTPRIGKAVEVNALWYAALRLMERWAGSLGQHAGQYAQLADQAEDSFRERFWNPASGCLFDVVDGPTGDDPSVRPNQIFAVSLNHGLLDSLRASSVVEVVRERLLTPWGLRSLAPGSEGYRGACVGDQRERDASYHQGTVWPWLLEAFLDAEERVEGPGARRDWAAVFQNHLREAGLGTISEIFDGDEPHLPRGCIAQAWSVAELLRRWKRAEAHEPVA